LIGDGRGAFSEVKDWQVGQQPYAIAVSDFNGDGFTDMAVTEAGSGDMVILAGQSNGQFNASFRVAVGPKPRGVAVADFNRDGKADLAVVDSVSGKVTLLLNTSGDKISPKDDAEKRTLETGLWGGPHVRFDVRENGAAIEFDCGYASIDHRIPVDADGRFDVLGTYESAGGPARATTANEDAASNSRPTGRSIRVSGVVSGTTMTLKIVVIDETQSLGRFELRRDAAPRLRKCLP
jgi:hypothetical protein